MSLTLATVNDQTTSFCSIRLDWLGDDVANQYLKAITVGHTHKPTEPGGAHPVPLPTGIGPYASMLSMDMVLDGWSLCLAKLRRLAPPPNGYTTVKRTIDIRFRLTTGQTLYGYKIYQAQVVEPNLSAGRETAEGLVIKLNFKTRRMQELDAEGQWNNLVPERLE